MVWYHTTCVIQVYESLGMTAYDVLKDTLALYWIAKGTDGTVVSAQCHLSLR